jgi:hypothetical protein
VNLKVVAGILKEVEAAGTLMVGAEDLVAEGEMLAETALQMLKMRVISHRLDQGSFEMIFCRWSYLHNWHFIFEQKIMHYTINNQCFIVFMMALYNG